MTVRIIYHTDDGFWAESPDMAGWSACADSLQELRELAHDGARFFFEGDDVEIEEYGLPVPVQNLILASSTRGDRGMNRLYYDDLRFATELQTCKTS